MSIRIDKCADAHYNEKVKPKEGWTEARAMVKGFDADNLLTVRCLDVFHHAATWVMGYARDLDRGRRTEDVEGLILYGDEVDALRIPMGDILQDIAKLEVYGGVVRRNIAFYRMSIRRGAIVDASGHVWHFHLGEPIPDGSLQQVEFNAEPRCIPFTDIMLGVERLARAADLSVQDMAFRYRGTVVRDGTTMLNVVQNHTDERKRIADALDRWHDQATQRASRAIAAKSAPPEDDEPPMPDEARGVILPRADVIRIFGGSIRTFCRWDHDGHSGGGVPWVKGKRRGNNVIYDIEKNWPTLYNMRGRDRDPAKDRLLAEEILRAKKAWIDNGDE